MHVVTTFSAKSRYTDILHHSVFCYSGPTNRFPRARTSGIQSFLVHGNAGVRAVDSTRQAGAITPSLAASNLRFFGEKLPPSAILHFLSAVLYAPPKCCNYAPLHGTNAAFSIACGPVETATAVALFLPFCALSANASHINRRFSPVPELLVLS